MLMLPAEANKKSGDEEGTPMSANVSAYARSCVESLLLVFTRPTTCSWELAAAVGRGTVTVDELASIITRLESTGRRGYRTSTSGLLLVLKGSGVEGRPGQTAAGAGQRGAPAITAHVVEPISGATPTLRQSPSPPA